MDNASIDARLSELMGHESWLRRFATSLVQSEAAADDLVQETWLAAMRNPPAADRPDRPWLARVVRNLARMRYRSDTRRRRREVASTDARADTPATELSDQPPSAEQLLERVQAQRMLADVVVELEEPYRTVVLLHYFEGLSAAEIARRENVPASTVRSRHKMALDKLRRALDRRNGGNRHAWCLALQPFVLPAPAAATSTGLLTGILAMKTIYKLALIAAALLALFLGVTALRGPSGDAQPVAGESTQANPERARRPLAQKTAAILPERNATADDDPLGDLRLEGQVIDAASLPVADAVISVSTNPRRTVRTEADGSFFIDGLLPRRYNLVATADERRAGPIGVRLTETSDPVILQLENGAALEFEVVAETSRAPLPGATVELRGWLSRRATADEDGRVSFAGIPFGRYTIAAWAPGYGRESAIAVATEGTQRERITLRRGASVSGRVLAPDGRPLAGARVIHKSMANNLQNGEWAHDAVLTDESGTFELPALARGTYRLAARHSGFATGVSEPITLDGVTAVRDVEVRLGPQGQLAGTVVSTGGEPVPSATVVIAMTEARWPTARRVITDRDGHFAIGDLPTGRVELVAFNERASSEHRRVTLAATERDATGIQEVTLTLEHSSVIAGVVVDAEGQPLDGIEVRAYPPANDTERPNPSSMAWLLRRPYRELTDAAGRFQIASLGEGAYELRANPPSVSARGFHWMRESVSARTGDEEVVIVVESEGRVTGRIAFADGSAPETFAVSFWDTRLDVRPYHNTDGRFAVAELPPGEYTVRIQGLGFEPVRMSGVKVKPGKETDLGTVSVHRGRRIAGVVVDADGRPVPGAEVSAGNLLVGSGLDADMGRFGPSFAAGTRATLTDEHGRFALHGVATGRVTLIAAHAERGRSTPIAIPVSERITTDLRVTLSTYGALEGQVLDDGKPAQQVQVIARSIRSPATVLMVGAADGHFRFDRLAPDEYSVQAMPGGFLGGTRFYTRTVTVSSGSTAQVTLEMHSGPGTVEIRPTTTTGNLAGSLIFHGRAEMTGQTAWELFEATGRGVGGDWSLGFSSSSSPAYISNLQPGLHTMCAVAFPDHVRGLDAMFEVLLTRMDSLPAVCRSVTVPASGDQQSVTIPVEVPPASAEDRAGRAEP